MYRAPLKFPKDSSKLKRKSNDISPGEDISGFLNDLKDTFSVLEGYGLAAPQIGISKRIIAINPQALGGGSESMLVMINPKLVLEGEKVASTEACFSVPYVSARVERHQTCRVSYLSEDRKPCELTFSGLAAACIQHEIDHLDGILFIDRVSRLKRGLLIKKIRKCLKAEERSRNEALSDFNRDHYDVMSAKDGEKKKTTYSRKRKQKKRRKKSSR